MNGNTILKNGKIVTADKTFVGDIRISGDKIAEIANACSINPAPLDKIIDCTGKIIIPGGIDAHTHFDMPSAFGNTSDDFAQGSKAAIIGGTTTVIDFAEPDSSCPLQQGLEAWHKKADAHSYCDYSFHMTITSWDESTPEQMQSMVNQGIKSFKLYTAYNGMRVPDDVIYKVLKQAKKLDALVMVHCENGSLVDALIEEKHSENSSLIENHAITRPDIVEKEAVSRVIDIAKLLDAKIYIVHLSSQIALEAAVLARENRSKVILETCPHYLLLDDSKYRLPELESAKYVMSPPLRSAENKEALWAGLTKNQVQTISTDHCSFNFHGQKDNCFDENKNIDFTKIPSGIPSVEHRMALMYTYGVKTGKISLNQFVALTSTNPAKIFGIYPQKGEIAIGSDADILVIKDIAEEGGREISVKNSAQHVDYTPYEGVRVDFQIEEIFFKGGRFSFTDSPRGVFL